MKLEYLIYVLTARADSEVSARLALIEGNERAIAVLQTYFMNFREHRVALVQLTRMSSPTAAPSKDTEGRKDEIFSIRTGAR